MDSIRIYNSCLLYTSAPAVGELTVEKKGEVLDGFKGGLLASSYEKEFVYKEGSLAGAKMCIRDRITTEGKERQEHE